VFPNGTTGELFLIDLTNRVSCLKLGHRRTLSKVKIAPCNLWGVVTTRETK
jgi:hypothetical protein